MKFNGKEVKLPFDYQLDVRDIESIQHIERDWVNCVYDMVLTMKNGDTLEFDGERFIDKCALDRIMKMHQEYYWHKSHELVGEPSIFKIRYEDGIRTTL